MVPLPHFTQVAAVAAPATELEVPAGQASHPVAAELEWEPTLQREQVDAPAELTLPAAQAEHAGSPAELKVPAPQFTQLSWLRELRWPAGQGLQVEVSAKVPGPHGVHDPEPAELTLPTGQAIQVAEDVAATETLKVPAVQSTQLEASALA